MVLAKSGSFTEKIGKNRNSIRKIHRRAAICEYTYYSQAYHVFFSVEEAVPSRPLPCPRDSDETDPSRGALTLN